MASMSASCPKFTIVPRSDASRRPSFVARSRASVLAGSAFPKHDQRKFHVLKAQAHEATVESSNSSPATTAKSETQQSMEKDAEPFGESTVQSDSVISAFMVEVSNLVKLVDSRDITELQLKQKDCELIIRKKEALLQPTTASSVVMMQPSPAMFPSQPQVSHTAPPPAPSSSTTPAPAASLPPPKGKKSAHPPLKCPMAGTFYRSPAPGEPPFVKVGDKVKKGQVVCIIEAMKLMNEIEADQSGTVVEILVEDGKPVSVDLPLLVIEP
ncbi:Biotin carboxyl carrier protein of acetyl-CoA carboxylase 2, chloroplastic [Apostasia shenzhenica]|uniref:Biotin carboxyl carrier protein of acetyl-CoA carboxylase n=1 Tax=Apostasia shenzhenica TaxID=1088818 RepID=A0A2I0AWI6_9ASPA|nr:Biotin carboxyl carrier protein of acetyl-CoA carboxylase 2, chloroplastic [Apostasia shenzhenica]